LRTRRLIVATGNAGKLAEFERLFAPAGIEVVGHATHVDEVGSTYAENAALKAVAAASATGEVALGDDSGLEVAALGGAPGLHSARYAATPGDRIAKLLAALAGQPRPWRARFVAVLALAEPDGEVRTVDGECLGEVVDPRGSGGFGYDPVFLVPELGRTIAELPDAEKDAVSHRGEAVRRLLATGWLS
jgi:XTP/dITP diphosphohydrolase